jgi:hypothetical protein
MEKGHCTDSGWGSYEGWHPFSMPYRYARMMRISTLAISALFFPKMVSAEPPSWAFAGDMGLASTHLADTYSLATIVDSPASLALRSRYDVAGAGGIGGQQGLSWQAGAVDSTAGPIALGVGMWRHADSTTATGMDMPGWRTPDDDLINPAQDTRVAGALAMTDVGRMVAVGASFIYDYGHTRFGGEGRQVHAVASAAARVAEGWRISGGIGGLGLWATDGAERHAKPMLLLGLSGEPVAGLSLGFDATRTLADEAAMELRTGVEGYVVPKFCLRAGAAWDGTDVELGAGLGFGGRTAGWDLGARLVPADLGWDRTEVGLGLRMAL